MKKNNLYISIILGAAMSLFFSSCDSFDQIVEFDVPLVPSKLVVNANYTIGEDSLLVIVSQSRNVGDSSTINLMNSAKVTISQNGNLLETLTYDDALSFRYQNAVYVLRNAKSKIIVNSSYTLKVSVAGFDDVQATQTVLAAPQIANISYIPNGYIFTSIDRSGEKVDALSFDVNDSPDENYYILSIKATVEDTLNNTIHLVKNNFYNDHQFSSSIFDDEYYQKSYLTDEIFNGKKVNLKLGIQDDYYYFDAETNEYIDHAKVLSYTVLLRAISKDKYLYEKTLQANQNNSDNIFAEPVVVHSNIENGFGIFSISTGSTLSIKKP